MKIEIFSDYACPFCYIGKRYLEQALQDFPQRDEVEVIFRSYELYPHASDKVTNTTQGRIEQKYRKTPDEALAMIRHIEEKAAATGLTMNYEKVQNTNTFNAHRLTHFAEAHGKGKAMTEQLFKAYFTYNLPLADSQVLLDLAQEVGLSRQATAEMLASQAFADEVQADLAKAKVIGVRAVPFFVINDRFIVEGSQPPAQFLALLNQLQAHSA